MKNKTTSQQKKKKEKKFGWVLFLEQNWIITISPHTSSNIVVVVVINFLNKDTQEIKLDLCVVILKIKKKILKN